MKTSIIRKFRVLRGPGTANLFRQSALPLIFVFLLAITLALGSCGSEDSLPESGAEADPGLQVEGSGEGPNVLVTTEQGNSDSFLVQLSSQPADEVILTLTGLDATEAEVSPETLVFTRENWDTAQTVEVRGLDDEEWDGSQTFNLILDTTESTDPAYNTMETTSLSVVNVDNDGPGLTVLNGVMDF